MGLAKNGMNLNHDVRGFRSLGVCGEMGYRRNDLSGKGQIGVSAAKSSGLSRLSRVLSHLDVQCYSFLLQMHLAGEVWLASDPLEGHCLHSSLPSDADNAALE
jgi:hypothetical protein